MDPTHPEIDRSTEKDAPLRDDIRRLGSLLGETVRAQEGSAIFDVVETIRRTSIRFHREDDPDARRELEAILQDLAPADAVSVIRAFSYFSHFANIAEDQHHVRRTRRHDISGSPARRGTIARALADALKAGWSAADIKAFFDAATVSPVLTAHPTEVRRKSMMHREIEIADLLDRGERCAWTPDELQDIDDKLRRAVFVLWQTNLLRQTKLDVMDEVTNGLSYYDYTFFGELPRLHIDLEDRLAALDPKTSAKPLRSFMRMGSWIGGDRDGNPFVTADVLRETLRKQSVKILRFYLAEAHTLGDELSMSTTIVKVSTALRDLTAASPDTSPHRKLEPYRRAISLIYARLAATQRSLNGTTSVPRPVAEVAPYPDCAAFVEDLDIIHGSLLENGAEILAQGRLRKLRRAADCFGFHLAHLDLRQNSAVHRATLHELFEVAEAETDYENRNESARIALLTRELRGNRPLAHPRIAYGKRTAAELAVLDAARVGQERYGRAAITTAIVSNTENVSDLQAWPCS